MRLAFSFSAKITVPAAKLSSLPADSKNARAIAGTYTGAAGAGAAAGGGLGAPAGLLKSRSSDMQANDSATIGAMTHATRIEHDLLGERAVPADAYYGIHTLRALENFPITGTPISIYPDLVVALACVKQAAAIANAELGLLEERRSVAIRLACEEVREGRLHDEFVVDVIQGGAGTSSNMNANEVICNRALEILGHAKGEYRFLHPLDHVNLSQSTNDVYRTAVRLALQLGIRRLLNGMAFLRQAFEAKAAEFVDVLKVGRTQLQDAVPMTLGQEFSAYAVMLGEDEQRLNEAAG